MCLFKLVFPMVNVRVIIPFFHGGISRCIYSFQLGFVVSNKVLSQASNKRAGTQSDEEDVSPVILPIPKKGNMYISVQKCRKILSQYQYLTRILQYFSVSVSIFIFLSNKL